MADQRIAYLNSIVRSPIGAAHGWLSGWHPADLLRAVVDQLLATNDLPFGHIDRVIFANATPVGALSAVSRSVAVAADWPAHTKTLEVTAGRTSGLQALELGRELIAHGASEALLVVSVDFASLVPPGAPLLRRDYGKPWTADSLRAFVQEGGTLPDGPYADSLRVSRADQDGYAVLQHQRASGLQVGQASVEKRVSDPERSSPLLGDPFSADQAVDPELDLAKVGEAEPMFADDGRATAHNCAQPGDGAVALLLTAVGGSHVIESAKLQHGQPTNPMEPLVAAVQLLLPAASLAVSEFSAAHVLAIAQHLDLDPDLINQHGGPIARCRLDGGELLAALADLVHLDQGDDLVLGSMTGDGAAIATRIRRA